MLENLRQRYQDAYIPNSEVSFDAFVDGKHQEYVEFCEMIDIVPFIKSEWLLNSAGCEL